MTGPTLAVRRQVIARDQGRCVVTGAYLVDPDTLRPYVQYSLQHRKARGMGGSREASINAPTNLILVEGTGTTGAHGRIESDRQWAQSQGYAVAQWQDPALVPVRHWLHGLAFVTADGWLPIPQGAEGALVVAELAARVAVKRGLSEEGLVHISQALHEVTASWVDRKDVA